jgi:type II secretory pathway predicted ATPase ExeA
MSKNVWNFRRPPFTLTPDTSAVYFHGHYQEAYHRTLEAIHQQVGFAITTGEVGTGKTTLLRHLAETLTGDPSVKLAVILNPALTPEQLLRAILEDFGLKVPPRLERTSLLRMLENFLLEQDAAHVNPVIFIDESQNLPIETLEYLRMCSNFEADNHKLVQIVLFGQQELDEMLARNELRQLRSRIACAMRLSPMTVKETRAYVDYRLVSSAPEGDQCSAARFSSSALWLLHTFAKGIPRRINIIARNSLAYIGQDGVIPARAVLRAAREFQHLERGGVSSTGFSMRRVAVACTAAIITLVGASYVSGNVGVPRLPWLASDTTAIVHPVHVDAIDPLKTYLSRFGVEIAGPLTNKALENLAGISGLDMLTMRLPVEVVSAAKLPAMLSATDSTGVPLVYNRNDQSAVRFQGMNGTEVAFMKGNTRSIQVRYLLVPRPYFRRVLREGSRGTSVEVVARILARIYPVDNASISGQVYNDTIATAVCRLQQEVGLTPDSAVGPATALLLYSKEYEQGLFEVASELPPVVVEVPTPRRERNNSRQTARSTPRPASRRSEPLPINQIIHALAPEGLTVAPDGRVVFTVEPNGNVAPATETVAIAVTRENPARPSQNYIDTTPAGTAVLPAVRQPVSAAPLRVEFHSRETVPTAPVAAPAPAETSARLDLSHPVFNGSSTPMVEGVVTSSSGNSTTTRPAPMRRSQPRSDNPSDPIIWLSPDMLNPPDASRSQGGL